ncbi:hypothetical protein TREMEDRAFT_65257 [Tremella mesenterica DSM 1558]|uniref:uncharacterized protein n=1 Tax=Tremella mesenterica (strain ATCC 24925 / CBS 8224 / DSM 1558 / NBRC 9311 / NRRL Y-6157 / RJB 2259-6 / UBC 559-6) TaxID=578456 RepID=UPI00032D4589|nr:uncharacterized protein TREMEDRAFT_65257 [Tremella mesenterica DSM 1558]EIW66849.1 hypothetical protein TREMEDRAFT_65257 [Tremella mesenterica DSM 1558]
MSSPTVPVHGRRSRLSDHSQSSTVTAVDHSPADADWHLLSPATHLQSIQGSFASRVKWSHSMPDSFPDHLSDTLQMDWFEEVDEDEVDDDESRASTGTIMVPTAKGISETKINGLLASSLGSYWMKRNGVSVGATTDKVLTQWAPGHSDPEGRGEDETLSWGNSPFQRTIRRLRVQAGDLKLLHPSTDAHLSSLGPSDVMTATQTSTTSDPWQGEGPGELASSNGLVKPDLFIFGRAGESPPTVKNKDESKTWASPNANPTSIGSLTMERKDDPALARHGFCQELGYLKTAHETFGAHFGVFMYRYRYCRMAMAQDGTVIIESSSVIRELLLERQDDPPPSTSPSDSDSDSDSESYSDHPSPTTPIRPPSSPTPRRSQTSATPPVLIPLPDLLNRLDNALTLALLPPSGSLFHEDGSRNGPGQQTLWDLFRHSFALVLAHPVGGGRLVTPAAWGALVVGWGQTAVSAWKHETALALAAKVYSRVGRKVKLGLGDVGRSDDGRDQEGDGDGDQGGDGSEDDEEDGGEDDEEDRDEYGDASQDENQSRNDQSEHHQDDNVGSGSTDTFHKSTSTPIGRHVPGGLGHVPGEGRRLRSPATLRVKGRVEGAGGIVRRDLLFFGENENGTGEPLCRMAPCRVGRMNGEPLRVGHVGKGESPLLAPRPYQCHSSTAASSTRPAAPPGLHTNPLGSCEDVLEQVYAYVAAAPYAYHRNLDSIAHVIQSMSHLGMIVSSPPRTRTPLAGSSTSTLPPGPLTSAPPPGSSTSTSTRYFPIPNLVSEFQHDEGLRSFLYHADHLLSKPKGSAPDAPHDFNSSTATGSDGDGDGAPWQPNRSDGHPQDGPTSFTDMTLSSDTLHLGLTLVRRRTLHIPDVDRAIVEKRRELKDVETRIEADGRMMVELEMKLKEGREQLENVMRTRQVEEMGLRDIWRRLGGLVGRKTFSPVSCYVAKDFSYPSSIVEKMPTVDRETRSGLGMGTGTETSTSTTGGEGEEKEKHRSGDDVRNLAGSSGTKQKEMVESEQEEQSKSNNDHGHGPGTGTGTEVAIEGDGKVKGRKAERNIYISPSGGPESVEGSSEGTNRVEHVDWVMEKEYQGEGEGEGEGLDGLEYEYGGSFTDFKKFVQIHSHSHPVKDGTGVMLHVEDPGDGSSPNVFVLSSAFTRTKGNGHGARGEKDGGIVGKKEEEKGKPEMSPERSDSNSNPSETAMGMETAMALEMQNSTEGEMIMVSRKRRRKSNASTIPFKRTRTCTPIDGDSRMSDTDPDHGFEGDDDDDDESLSREMTDGDQSREGDDLDPSSRSDPVPTNEHDLVMRLGFGNQPSTMKSTGFDPETGTEKEKEKETGMGMRMRMETEHLISEITTLLQAEIILSSLTATSGAHERTEDDPCILGCPIGQSGVLDKRLDWNFGEDDDDGMVSGKGEGEGFSPFEKSRSRADISPPPPLSPSPPPPPLSLSSSIPPLIPSI